MPNWLRQVMHIRCRTRASVATLQVAQCIEHRVHPILMSCGLSMRPCRLERNQNGYSVDRNNRESIFQVLLSKLDGVPLKTFRDSGAGKRISSSKATPV